MAFIESTVFNRLMRYGLVPIAWGCGRYLGAQKMGMTMNRTAIYAATFEDCESCGRRLVVYGVVGTLVNVISLDGQNDSQVYFDSYSRKVILQAIKRNCCHKVTARRRRRYY